MNAAVAVDRFVHYLEVKKLVDDRSLNPRVWEALAQALAARPLTGARQVVELGCGIGTMLERLLEWTLFGSEAAQIEYLGVDASAGLIAAARRRMPDWAGRLGFDRVPDGAVDRLQRDGMTVRVRWQAAEAFDFAGLPDQAACCDLLLAHAFLDLVDARSAVQAFLPLLRPGGLFYFSLVFDGLTRFEPELDRELDPHLERLYHQTMDQRVVGGRPSGHSQTGRQLLGLLPPAGGQILATGSSDWVVTPNGGGYRPGEREFVGYILDTLEAALHGHPDLPAAELDGWLAGRRAQLARAELSYRAHQLDYAGSYAPQG